MRKKKCSASLSSTNVCVQISDKDIQFSFPKRNFFMLIALSKVIPGTVDTRDLGDIHEGVSTSIRNSIPTNLTKEKKKKKDKEGRRTKKELTFWLI